MGFVIQAVGGEAAERPRTGLYSAVSDNAATGRLGANTAIAGSRDTP